MSSSLMEHFVVEAAFGMTSLGRGYTYYYIGLIFFSLGFILKSAAKIICFRKIGVLKLNIFQ